MAVLIHKSLNPMDFIWSFSIWLEAFSILPQLTVINKLKDIENITAHYLLFLGLYRIFYIFHWYLFVTIQDFPLGKYNMDFLPGRHHPDAALRRLHILFR